MMKTKLAGIALFALTLASVAVYPSLNKKPPPQPANRRRARSY